MNNQIRSQVTQILTMITTHKFPLQVNPRDGSNGTKALKDNKKASKQTKTGSQDKVLKKLSVTPVKIMKSRHDINPSPFMIHNHL